MLSIVRRRRIVLSILACSALLGVAAATIHLANRRGDRNDGPSVAAEGATSQMLAYITQEPEYFGDVIDESEPAPPEFGVVIDNIAMARIQGSYQDVRWTNDGRYAFATDWDAGSITVLDTETNATVSVECGCREPVPYGRSSMAWAELGRVRRADPVSGGVSIDDPRSIPGIPAEGGTNRVLAAVGEDLILAQTVVLGAQLGSERIIRVKPSGATTVLVAEVSPVQKARVSSGGRLAITRTVRRDVCWTDSLQVVEVDGTVISADLTNLRGGLEAKDTPISIHDIWWDGNSLYVTASAVLCTSTPEQLEPQTGRLAGSGFVVQPGTEGRSAIRLTTGGKMFSITPERRLLDPEGREASAVNVAAIALSSKAIVEGDR